MLAAPIHCSSTKSSTTLLPLNSTIIEKLNKQLIDSCIPYSQYMNSNATWTTLVGIRERMTQSCHGILASLAVECNPFNTNPFMTETLKGTPICSDPHLVDWEQHYFNPATDSNMLDFPSPVHNNNRSG